MRATSRIRARDGWLIGLVIAGIVAVSIAARSHPVATHGGSGPGGTPSHRTQYNGAGSSEGTSRSHTFHLGLHLGLPQWLAGLLKQSLLLILVIGVVVLLITVVPRARRRRAHRSPQAEVRYAPDDPVKLRDAVSATFDTTLQRLRRGAPEEAIIACWIQLEVLAEAAGSAVQPWQTTGEAARQWLAGLPFDADALAELAELYREARFSQHRMSAQTVELAQRTLLRLRANLAGSPLKPSDV